MYTNPSLKRKIHKTIIVEEQTDQMEHGIFVVSELWSAFFLP